MTTIATLVTTYNETLPTLTRNELRLVDSRLMSNDLVDYYGTNFAKADAVIHTSLSLQNSDMYIINFCKEVSKLLNNSKFDNLSNLLNKF